MNRKRGIGLIEGVLFILIAIALITGGVVYFKQASEAARVNSAVHSIVGIQSGVRSLYQSGGSFGAGEGSDLGPTAVAAGIVSSRLVAADGQLSNEWAGDIEIRGYPEAFVLDYRGVPKEACIRLAPHSTLGNGPAGNGIAAVAVNGVLVDVNDDGTVSPSEAAAACGTAAGDQAMRWAFLPDANMRIDPAQLEDVLDITPVGAPTETGRTTHTEVAACTEGFTGNQTRSREVISYSDGSSVPSAWSDWDTSSCVADVVETGRASETESAACPEGFTGSQTRFREVVSYSDGTSVPSAWSEWSIASCVADVVETGRNTESETAACQAGSTGQQSRSREVISYSDGSVVQGEWGEWDVSGCVAAPVLVSQETQTRQANCPAGEVGSITESRNVSLYSDGSTQSSAWQVTSNSCVSGSQVRTSFTEYSTEGRIVANGNTCVYQATRTVYVLFSSATTSTPWVGAMTTNCATPGSNAMAFAYRACPAHPYGQQRALAFFTNGTLGQMLESWANFTCRN